MLAIHCNFGEFSDRALRDRFLCGLSNPKIQNKLLNREDLTFKKACRIAKAMEMAERNTQEFRIHPTTSEGSQVNQLTTKGMKNNEQWLGVGVNNQDSHVNLSLQNVVGVLRLVI